MVENLKDEKMKFEKHSVFSTKRTRRFFFPPHIKIFI
jgi:hypothetical protein